MKNPYFVSRPSRVTTGEGTEDFLSQTGLNTGNLLFISSIERVLGRVGAAKGVRFDARAVGREHDGLVIPAANWLNSNNDLEGLASLIEASNLPCVVVGLGAQSFSVDRIPTLKPGTERFLRVISERSRSISVRGPFTADVLARYGVTNVDVTGCPSLLWHVDRPASATKPEGSAPTRVAMNGTRSDHDPTLFTPGSTFEIGLLLSRTAIRRDFDYVAQTERIEIELALDPARAATDAERTFLGRIYHRRDEAAVVDYVRGHVRAFGSVDAWVDYMRGVDFAIGTRLHGIIAALLAGTPAMLVTHDTRTAEMSALAGIPTVDSTTLLALAKVPVEKLYAELDLDGFNRRQVAYREHFRAFLEHNRLEHRLT